MVFTFVPIPPFIALTIVSILQRKGSPWRLGIQLGLLVVAQYLISQEVLVDVAILTFRCSRVRRPSPSAENPRDGPCDGPACLGRAPRYRRAVGLSRLDAGSWSSAFNGAAFPSMNPYTNDLLSFFVPGPLQKVSFGMRSLGNRLMVGPNPANSALFLIGSNPTEFDGYIGVLVLVLAGFLVWRSRRSPRMQLATVLFLVAAVLSLGPYLVVDARSTHLPLPFLLLAHSPCWGSSCLLDSPWKCSRAWQQ